jgi:hypothetical protein
METFLLCLVQLADVISGHFNLFFSFVASEFFAFAAFISDCFVALIVDATSILLSVGFVSHAFAGVTGGWSDISDKTLALARKWHGSIDERFDNIDKLVVTIQGHSSWSTPPSFSQIVANRLLLSTLIPKCRSGGGSADDRTRRNTLLRTTIALCLLQVKLWAYALYNNPGSSGFTIDDLHSLGFLLPGEGSGHHSRSVSTDVLAEVKVIVLSSDVIRVVIDQATGENAALVTHGWPEGVRMALIVILSVDDKSEIYRQHTTRLHNEIRMPDGSHGKQFVIKAAFLKHVDDRPKFGPQPTFTMPYSTEDIASPSSDD